MAKRREPVHASPDGPLRVALFTDTFFEVNGAAHTLRQVAATFRDQGAFLDVYTYGPKPEIVEDGTVRILCFDHMVASNYYEKLQFELVPDHRIGEHFRRQMKSAPYDVVHLATPGSMGIAGRSLARRRKLPVVGTYHTHLADYVALRSFRAVGRLMHQTCWRFMRWFYEPCASVLCPTQDVANELRDHGFRNQLGVFTRGVDTELFCDAKRQRHDGRVVASYVGRCAPEKNVDLIPVITQGVDADVWVVGDGPKRSLLEQLMPRAKFCGYLRGETLAQAYADSDVLLFPSVTDTFGNVVLEAMASGVVPIVAEGPGPSSYVTHGTNAMVCKGADAMRSALDKLTRDPDLRLRMRRAARSFAERRDWSSAVRGLMDTYHRVVGR